MKCYGRKLLEETLTPPVELLRGVLLFKKQKNIFKNKRKNFSLYCINTIGRVFSSIYIFPLKEIQKKNSET